MRFTENIDSYGSWPGNGVTGPYLPALASVLDPLAKDRSLKLDGKYSYLNCAIFSDTPTLLELKRHAQHLARDVVIAHRQIYPEAGKKKKKNVADDLMLPGGPLDCFLDLDKPFQSDDVKQAKSLDEVRKAPGWKEHNGCEFLAQPQKRLNLASHPTLITLKRHLQAIANVIMVLEPSLGDTNGMTTIKNIGALDWLQDIDSDYRNDEKNHSEPLHALRNTHIRFPLVKSEDLSLASAAKLEDRGSKCPFFVGASIDHDGKPVDLTVAELTSHANAILTILDDRLAQSGGILSLLPKPNTDAYEQASHTLLGQWIQYTAALTRRIAELEQEVLVSREVLAGEANVPKQLASTALQLGDDKVTPASNPVPLAWPQDQWILCDLTSGLYATLNAKLESAERERVREDVNGRKHLGAENQRPARHVLAWIDVNSRIFRIQGLQTLFMIPGYGVHPNTAEAREMEAKPLIQTVQRPAETRSGTKFERDMIKALTLSRAEQLSALQVSEVSRKQNVKLAKEIERLKSLIKPPNKQARTGKDAVVVTPAKPISTEKSKKIKSEPETQSPSEVRTQPRIKTKSKITNEPEVKSQPKTKTKTKLKTKPEVQDEPEKTVPRGRGRPKRKAVTLNEEEPEPEEGQNKRKTRRTAKSVK